MTNSRHGTVITFYSFTGGTGRTMALANVAWILAANGHRVLVADWHFESPGLHRYFRPFIRSEDIDHAPGVTDLIRGYELEVMRAGGPLPQPDLERLADVTSHAIPLDWEFPGDGCLHLLPTGSQDRNYVAIIGATGWDEFYERRDGGRFFDVLRDTMRGEYDYALIDSPNGWNELADICAIQLPDVLVSCFPLSHQGIEGAVASASAVRFHHAEREIRVLPVPTRVDLGEQEKAQIGRQVARQRLAGLPKGMPERERDVYWRSVEVPHCPYYSFEEVLAPFGDRPDMPSPLLSAYESIARFASDGVVERLPPMNEFVRARTLGLFTRRAAVAEENVALSYAPADQAWAEWVERLLTAAGIRVHDVPEGTAEATPLHARLMVIVSATSAEGQAALVARDDRGAFAVYVDVVPPLPAFELDASAFVAGLSADEAIERLLRLVGHVGIGADLDAAKLGVRFPGTDREVVGLPVRNPRFTGREHELRQLRAHLRAHSGDGLPWPVPVVLRGMGGVGKSEIALEYAHRFAASYDVVWWLDDDAKPLDTAPLGPSRVGSAYPRWLVVCDHAEDLERVVQRLPAGAGHLLLTSRDTPWQDLVHALSIDVLPRAASLRLLQTYLPTIEPEQAMSLAAAVGDLPLALCAAGDWLASTGTGVDDYVRQVRRDGVSSVEHTWSQSLARLRDDHPPGFHLLAHLSTLAPEIGLDIVYADEFATALAGVNPATATRPYRALLVQQISRLALLRLDVGHRAIHVHPLLQHLVRGEVSASDLDEIRHRMHGVLAALRPTAGPEDPASWPRLGLLWPHLEHCAAADCGDETTRELLLDQVRHAWLSGELSDGQALASRIGASWLDGGADGLRRQSLRLRHMLAGLIREQGGFEPAYALDQEVLAQQGQLVGADHPDVFETTGGVAADLRALGRYAAAVALDERNVAASTAALGPDHPATLTARSGLACSERLAGNVRAAGDGDQEVYERRRAILGDHHPRTLRSGGALGRDLRERGEYRSSVALLRAVRAATEETFGPDRVPTLLASANLAVSLRCAGLAELAAPLLEEAYEQLNERLGPNSPYTLACRHSRATNLVALEQLPSAAAELEHVQLRYEGELGPRHPYALACASNRAVASRITGDLGFARSLSDEAAQGMREVLGPDHPHALAVRMNLAILRAEEGDLPAARELARAVAADTARVLGADHPDTLRGQVNLALMTGPDDALDRLEATLGPKHPSVRAARERRYVHRTLDPHLF
ncbi:cellulose biosynthesis protein BcsQ [Asanoa ferruginea]|uniref:Cellulose biosynthesis protein BcsQ n=1 Tax=Asanoa ferruginea TaxID=53367 RepID=A0A3D9ZNK3_9ACTN|nr:FxSxx-COOH system tetratricopeptide repeat protein [Asanoa ferruginea]REF98777.1 cellulose biosynthesis protein BcsQ [Asanoa ferruginea]GIF49518.1 hypothetical protein Afe04nite_40570 [Asanoa ferruginea]